MAPFHDRARRQLLIAAASAATLAVPGSMAGASPRPAGAQPHKPIRQVVIDTETTGLGPQHGHRIIEIACVELIDRVITGQHFHQYVNPQHRIEPGAQFVHGISNEMLADKPVFKDVAEPLLAFINGAELIIHRADFDIGFLYTELSQVVGPAGATRALGKVTDTWDMARELHPGQKIGLDALSKRYSLNVREQHGATALADSYLTAELYLRMTATG